MLGLGFRVLGLFGFGVLAFGIGAQGVAFWPPPRDAALRGKGLQ